MDNKFVYRFRSIKSILEYKEIEKQTIFFPKASMLNDPMESFKNIYWCGDKIAWQKLLEHYISSLAQILLLHHIDHAHKLSIADLPYIPHPNTSKKELHTNFVSNNVVSSFLMFIEKNPSRRVYKYELCFYLKSLHSIAFNTIIKLLEDKGLTKATSYMNESNSQLFKYLEEHCYPKEIDNRLLDTFFMQLLNKNILSYDIDQINDNSKFIYQDFTQEYVNNLGKLIYHDVGVVSFVEECDDVAMWSYYADNHKGICLKFKSHADKESNLTMNLYDIVSYSGLGENYGYRQFPLKKVSYGYDENKLDINFFENLGRLTYPDLCEWWYCSEDQISSCYSTMNKNRDEWVSGYWEFFYRHINTKHKNWAHEKELRLIKSLSLDGNQSIIYNFEDLDGIIFGIATLESDKREIIKQIKRKCKSLFDKIQDIINDNEYKLNNEDLMKLHSIIQIPEIYNTLSLEQKCNLSITNSHLLKYKCALVELCKNELFEKLTHNFRRDDFNLYQAYYCNISNTIKYFTINVLEVNKSLPQ